MARRQVSIFINGREVANQMKSIRAEKRKVTGELNLMTIGTKKYNTKMRELDQLNAVITKHNRRVRGVASTWDKVKASAGRLIAFTGIALTADAIVDYGKALFNTGVEMDTLARKAETVLGSTLDFVTREARKNAQAMGLTTSQYVDATTAIADLLIPMGFQRREAAEMSTTLIDLSGALSEWTGGQRSAQEVSKILGKAILGEREQLKELGISIQEADIKARLAEKGLDKLTGELLQQAKAAATLELIMQRSVDAQTSFAENSDSLVRRQAELSAKFREVFERLATVLLPVFERLLGFANDLADGIAFLSDAISGLMDPAGKAVKVFDEQIESVRALEAELPGLLSRYEELTSQTSLSAAEQDELQQLISRIGEVTPTAITKVDEYGNVLAISAAASRDFMEAERARLEFVNKEAIGTLEKLIAKSKERQATLKQQIETGQEYVAYFFDIGDYEEISAERISKKREKLKNVTRELLGAEAELRRLRGDAPESSEPETPTTTSSAEQIEDAAAIARAKKRAERDQKDLERQQQQLEKLKEMTVQMSEEIRLAKLSEDEKRLEDVRQHYQKAIELAKELETAQIIEATEQRKMLEMMRDQQLRELSNQLAQERIDEDLEREAQRQEKELDQYLDHLAQKEEAQKTINQALAEQQLTEQEAAFQNLQNYYYDLIDLADQFGIDSEGLLIQYAERRQQLEDKFEKEGLKRTIEAQKKRMQALAQSFSGIAEIIGGTMQAIGEDNKAFTGLTKVLALTQIGFKSAEAIAAATAASAGVPFPGNLVAIATAVGAVGANIKQARDIIKNTEAPQRKHGGWLNVTGQDDGITYRAQYLGRPRSGMLPSHPVVLASEVGREYFVSNHALEDPQVFNHVQAIDNIVRRRVPQYRAGGATVPLPAEDSNAAVTSSAAPDLSQLRSTVNDLAAQVSRLSEQLDQGIYAVIEDDTTIALIKRFRILNEAAGGTLDQ